MKKTVEKDSLTKFQIVDMFARTGKTAFLPSISSWGPISEQAPEMGINPVSSCHVETVVLMSRVDR